MEGKREKVRKRSTQELTDTCDIYVCKPMAVLENPVDLSSTARQRIRKQWLSPCRKTVSNAKRSESFNMIDLILPISAYLNFMRQRYQNLMI